MSSEIKVFVIDNSAVTRVEISNVIRKTGLGLVIGTAPTGEVALEKLNFPKYKADIIAIDIEMHEEDGIEIINKIMERYPTPILIFTRINPKTVEKALKRLENSRLISRLIDYISKPNPRIPSDQERFITELTSKLENLASIDVITALLGFDLSSLLDEEETVAMFPVDHTGPPTLANLHDKIILIGASTGGPRAISLILSRLPPTTPPIIIAQHNVLEMNRLWVGMLQDLNPEKHITIPLDNEIILPNRVYVIPGATQCRITEQKTIELFEDENKVYSPSIDLLFTSGAAAYGRNVLAIVLTGMGSDGHEGAKRIKAARGTVFAEDESTAVIYSMPKFIIDNDLADNIIPLSRIPAEIRRYGWI